MKRTHLADIAQQQLSLVLQSGEHTQTVPHKVCVSWESQVISAWHILLLQTNSSDNAT